MSAKLSYDLDYVRNETCLMKWTVDDGSMPANPQPCGRPAVAGVGLTRGGRLVHPRDPRAVADMFVCEKHVQGLAGLDDQAELVPKIGKAGSN